MFDKTILIKGLVVAFGGGAALWCSAALAQDTSPSSSQDVQRVIVTGSNIRRTDSETPSPVQVITDEDLKKSGYTSVQQVLQTITANGQGTLSQGFSGAFASGASGIALRGLNVGATLVLIDGHRMAPFPIGDDGQRSFVDISNIPFDSIERVEILKDGASAIYGSDAIAGVVNIILKRSFVGAKISGDLGDSWKNDGQTAHIAATFGQGDLDKDGHNFYIAAEARKQYQIKFSDRPGLLTQTDFTGSGGINTTPGAANNPLLAHPRSGTGYITDPTTGNVAGFMPGCNATSQAANQCTYSDTWDQIQPETKNLNLVSRYTMKLGSDWQASVQATFFEGTSQQVGGPGRSLTNGSTQGVTSGPGVTPTLLPAIPQTTIPSTNPSFPKGTGLSVGNLYYTFLNLGPTITDTQSEATRFIGDINGSVGAWNLEASAGYTEVALNVTGQGYINYANLQTALNSTTDPFLIGQQNDAANNAFVAPTLSTHDTSKLSFAHVGASRDIVDLKGGPLSVAVGADYMHRDQNALAPASVAAGQLPNEFSNNFTVGIQNVASVDAEIDAPVLKSLDLDAAVRYDHYNLSGGKASPKVGFKWTPVQEFALRGTASKGFRAPGPAENGKSGQTFFAGSSSDPVLCANDNGNPQAQGNFPSQCDVDLPGLQSTNAKLHPETSKSFTLGAIVEPVKGFSATIDLWQIEIDNQIVSGGPSVTVRGTSLAPLEMSNGDGTTSLVVPPVAPIAYTTTSYINANTTKTNGVDLGFQVRHRFGAMDYQSDLTVSYAHKYDLTIDGTTYHLAGTHGPFFYSGDTGNPRTRVQWGNTVGQGPWQLTGTMNYISSFNVTDPSAVAFTGEPQDDCLSALSNAGGAASTDFENELGNGTIPSQSMCKVHSFITFDMQGRFDINKNVSVHGSVLNLFNKKFSTDWATYGGALGAVPYNPSMHQAGAIGRYFTLGGTYTF